jgi:adenine-specific DNA-methyltransferase
MAQHDHTPDGSKTYAFDPHAAPALDWAGKKEGVSFDVPTTSIHVHEVIKPLKIIAAVRAQGDEGEAQGLLFPEESWSERQRRFEMAIECYQHHVNWANRLIAGDSLVVMNSLLEKEGMAGKVQMVYIDPPYGIKYGSNFQPYVDKRDVKDKDEDLASTPETIKAFRDTWEMGIHSYLTYLRNRLLLVRELLADSGSVFVQISDENVHHVRELCDEVFGVGNFVAMIYYRTTGGFETNDLSRVGDFIIWYAKDKSCQKYHQLFNDKDSVTHEHYGHIEMPDGTRRAMTPDERKGLVSLPNNAKIYTSVSMCSAGAASVSTPFEFDGKTYFPPSGWHWKPIYPVGLKRLVAAKRVAALGNTLRYIHYLDDFPLVKITNLWADLMGADDKAYVVQTNVKVIQRCMLMTTDPGDIVLDITCGSGTTAYVAEQWGRRWITCDTSRVAVQLAKQRLMTAVYDYYRLADEKRGVSGGFVYKTVPHVTLKSIANDEPPKTETLYDRPEIDKNKVRVAGPFNVEALPAPVGARVVTPLDAGGATSQPKRTTGGGSFWLLAYAGAEGRR